MLLYEQERKCNKCGCGIALTKFVPAYSHRSFSSDTEDHEAAEHMRRKCFRCDYEWNELPLDTRGV